MLNSLESMQLTLHRPMRKQRQRVNKSVCFGPVSPFFLRVLWLWRLCQGLVALTLAATSFSAQAQQRRDALPPMTPMFSSSTAEAAQDAEFRQQKRMRWLKEANGALPADSEVNAAPEVSPSSQPSRMHGMSREERRRLRRDILEAGYTAYSPGVPGVQSNGQLGVAPSAQSFMGRGPER